MTQILPIDKKSLEWAEKIIEAGGAVAFPTETVYGLGANALDTAAVDNIFKIKGRPNDNPLIVHVTEDYDLSLLVDFVPHYAQVLAKKFLPGPLTMVYPSKGKVSPSVSCGLDTLAIRIPSHEGARAFLRAVKLPIAAPSANISKHVSPTSAQHVFADLDGKIELILDGGSSKGGIESTVLDCTGEYPVILRSGLVTREMIEKAVGKCGVYTYKEGEAARSPGMKYKHYSPKCQTSLFYLSELEKAICAYKKACAEGLKVAILCDKETSEKIQSNFGKEFTLILLGATPEEMAANLYAKLREAENTAQYLIAVAPAREDGVMAGVMNRLKKACR